MRYLLLTVCSALLAVPAAARGNPEGDARWEACKADAERLCADVEPGGGRIMDCLKARESELSEGCKPKGGKKHHEKSPEMMAGMRACEADKAKFCGDVEPGEGRVIDCMKAHKDQVSADCRAFMDKKEGKEFKKKHRAEGKKKPVIYGE